MHTLHYEELKTLKTALSYLSSLTVITGDTCNFDSVHVGIFMVCTGDTLWIIYHASKIIVPSPQAEKQKLNEETDITCHEFFFFEKNSAAAQSFVADWAHIMNQTTYIFGHKHSQTHYRYLWANSQHASLHWSHDCHKTCVDMCILQSELTH